jgi:hypothetical protein
MRVLSRLLTHFCHGNLRVFSLYFWPKYAAVNNTNIESVAVKRQKCYRWDKKMFCYFYPSSAFFSAKFNFIRRERFYDDYCCQQQ